LPPTLLSTLLPLHHRNLCCSLILPTVELGTKPEIYVIGSLMIIFDASVAKQHEREHRIQKLDPVFGEPLTTHDIRLLSFPVATVVENVRNGHTDPSDLLVAYGKKALRAHEETNCLTEVMIASAQTWAKNCAKGPLAGMPVSLKDTAGVEGWDSCIGYSAWVNKPIQKDSALVELLHDAGAVPFVKTSVPISLLSFESTSDVFGVTTNPHKKTHSPGGSSGGEAALLAYGGSRIGIGTDVAGSVRCPAHYSGVYSIKASMHRFLKTGNPTSMPGQEGIPAVYSPMARTLGDLETFWKAIFIMKPWTYDHTVSIWLPNGIRHSHSHAPKCLPIPWRDVDLSHKKLKWGVMWKDGTSCLRSL
jgi:Asp-tRNA(Asn)/Glu-tRNA(Gln) amidotransferase A subunit family amidase